MSLTFPVASRTTHEPEARVTMRTNHQANIYLHFKIIYTYKEIYGTDGMFAYNSNRIQYITVKEALPGTESGKHHGPQYWVREMKPYKVCICIYLKSCNYHCENDILAKSFPVLLD